MTINAANGPYGVRCPECLADPGQPCVDRDTDPARDTVHWTRKWMAHQQAAHHPIEAARRKLPHARVRTSA